ncbi:MAG: hypothetical protein PHN69_02470 [Candidatus Pacebacteria bacterium]|nr:hypothetical protein [Candidatus Paceibacterota bacterium]
MTKEITKPVLVKKSTTDGDTIKTIKNGNTVSILIPKKTNLNSLKEALAYKSNISNMFSSTDPTVTADGYMRLFTDTGYKGDVIKALTIADQDDLAGGLIDSIVNTSNTEIIFTTENENNIWKKWKELINLQLKNILPGTKMLNLKLLLSLVKTGMAVPDFEWEEVMIDRKTYWLPTKIIPYSVLDTELRTDVSTIDEQVLVNVSDAYYNSVKNNATTDVAYKNLFVEYKGEDKKTKRSMIKNNAYAIKFNYDANAKTLYPVPMLKRSFESIALRHQLMDSDMSTLEYIINKIIQVKVGDKENPPQNDSEDSDGKKIEGDISAAQGMFSGMLQGKTEYIVTPYYYEIKIHTPDIELMKDNKKFTQSTNNIMANFGILIDGSSDDNPTLEKINLVNYLNLSESLQEHIVGWYKWLAYQIIKKNKGKIKELPKIGFVRPSVDDTEMLEFYKKLTDQGYVDIYSLLEMVGQNPDTIIERLKDQKEKEKENPGLFEARATFKQISQTPGSTPETPSTSKEVSISKKEKK